MNKTQIFINAVAQCDQFVMFIDKLLKEESIEGNLALIALRDHIQKAKCILASDLLHSIRGEVGESTSWCEFKDNFSTPQDCCEG